MRTSRSPRRERESNGTVSANDMASPQALRALGRSVPHHGAPSPSLIEMPTLLETFDSPTDLKRLPVDALPSLRREIREAIIVTCARTWAHLGSSLGAVELNVALHYAFNSPVDRLVVEMLRAVTRMSGPVLLHARTTKEKEEGALAGGFGAACLEAFERVGLAIEPGSQRATG
jgi:hypothetical protein